MRSNVAAIVLGSCVLTMISTAQAEPPPNVHFGASLGITVTSFYEASVPLVPMWNDYSRPMSPSIRPTIGAFVRLSGASRWQLDLGIAYAWKAATSQECGAVDCTGRPVSHVTWTVMDIELPALARWSRPIADDLALQLGFGVAPQFSFRARDRSVEPTGATFDEDLYDFLPVDVAALASAGLELARPPYRIGLEVRGSLGLVDRNYSDESPLNLHEAGLYVLGTVVYWP